MEKQTSSSCNIISTATALPKNPVPTEEMLSALSEKMTDELLSSVKQLGVNQRYLIVERFSDYLVGKAERKLLSNTTALGAEAVKKSIESSGIDPAKICLLIGITNTANRHLPCFGYEVLSSLTPLISPETNVLNLQDQGCSVLLKGVEVAQNYLKNSPDKYVVIVAAESHSGFMPQLLEKKFYGLREAKELMAKGGGPIEIINSMRIVEAFLFGDGAVAFLLGVRPGNPILGPTAHLTDVEKGDTEVIYMNEGGILVPAYRGFPHYILSADVPKRGAFYAEHCVKKLLTHHDAFFSSAGEADICLIHTGSKKILNGVCDVFGIEKDSKKTEYSYKILSDYGNLSSVSVGFMMEHCIKNKIKGKGLIVSFGVGFSCSTGFIEF